MGVLSESEYKEQKEILLNGKSTETKNENLKVCHVCKNEIEVFKIN
jgi:hypothetical protein